MADWFWYDEDQGQYNQAQGHYLEEELVEVLDTSVQDSVGKAMNKALQPLLEGAQGTQQVAVERPVTTDSAEAWPHRAMLAQLSAGFAEHGYSAPAGKKRTDKSKHKEPAKESDSEESSSEEEGHGEKRRRKRRKSLGDEPQVDASQFFVPEDIIHP